MVPSNPERNHPTYMEQLNLFKEQIPVIKDIDYVDLGILMNEHVGEELFKKDQYYLYKTGGVNRWIDDAAVYPFIKNNETGNIRMPTLMSGEGSYPRINLQNGDKRRKFSMHKMVALAFINNPDPKNKVLVDHVNHNVYDYKVSNLRWLSHKENSRKRNPKYNQQQLLLRIKNET